MKQSARNNSTVPVIAAAVIAVHLVVGLIFWGCSGGGDKKKQGEDGAAGAETAATQETAAPQSIPDWLLGGAAPESGTTSAPARYRKPSTNPNFGKPLDFQGADTSDMQKRLLPNMEKQPWEGTGIIVDMDTHRVLWERNSRKSVPIASMTKMMTVLLVAEELERNPNLTLDTEITVTQSAMNAIPRREGDAARVGLAVGSKITVRDLLLCVLLPSANDAANQLAEVVCGDVDKFIARMNERARELGFTSMKFYTTNGLNNWRGNERQTSVASAADMVRLGERLLEYPFLIEMMSHRSAQVAVNGQKRTVFSSNILVNTGIKGLRGLKPIPGVDGMKTGYIKVSGACLTFSVLRNGRRMIGCVTKFPLHRDRYNFCRRLIDWAYDPASLDKPVKPAPAPGRTRRGSGGGKRRSTTSGRGRNSGSR